MSKSARETLLTILILAVIAFGVIYVGVELLGFLIRNWWIPVGLIVVIVGAILLFSRDGKGGAQRPGE